MVTSGLEDYLEFIYNSLSKEKQIRAIDIANDFKISRSSVSEALIRLADLGLIIYEGRKGIKITEKGIEVAKEVIAKHNILSKFFSQILGLNYNLAQKNACKIEHVIDKEVIEKINEFNNYCIKNNIQEKFKNNKK